MRGLLLFAGFLLAANVMAKDAMPLADDPVVEQRMIGITEELRCLVCQNESLAGSHADLAEDLRREVRDLIRQGKSDEEVKEFLVSRYGDFVLYRPPLKATTLLLWIGPFVLVLVGLLVLVLYLRRRSVAVAATDVALSDDDKRRAEALLKDNP
jgi:cytochrome c-type biogenesis protein CcmH